MTSDSPDSPAIDDALLHAFVDGSATPDQIEHVAQWLVTHPDDARSVAHWQAQRAQLRLLSRNVLDEAVPAALTATLRPERAQLWSQWSRWSQWSGLAVAAGLVALGVAGGWLSRGALPEPALARATPTFVREARLAHVLYTPEKRHPVEVGAEQSTHLVDWLSRRLGAKLIAPDLASVGYTLMGGRLLPGEGGQARAQFMYERAPGDRLTLHVSVFAANAAPEPTTFRFAENAGGNSFYWIDGRYGYAVTSAVPRAELVAVANAAYAQLATLSDVPK